MTAPRVGVVVLAAGRSARLGRPKQLLPVSGRPLLERTLDLARTTALEPKVVVLGAAEQEIRAVVNLRGFDVVRNEDFASGQAGSLRAALDALPGDLDGVVVMLGDQPLTLDWLPEALAASFDPSAHVAARPRYADGAGHPVLLARALFSELRELTGDVGARDVLRRHATRVHEVALPGIPAPQDVDTEADYIALLRDWSSTGAPDVPRYCQRCGAAVEQRDIHGRLRPVCPRCRYTYFADPKLAAVVVVQIGGRIVLQRRAIDPGAGLWTFPGGFVDRGEDVAAAAAREVHEEVRLHVTDVRLLGVYADPGETVVLVAYHARADGQTPVAGDESSDVGLFDPRAVPPLAFPRDPRVLADWLRADRALSGK